MDLYTVALQSDLYPIFGGALSFCESIENSWSESGTHAGEYYHTGGTPYSSYLSVPPLFLVEGSGTEELEFLNRGTIGSLADNEWDWAYVSGDGSNQYYLYVKCDERSEIKTASLQTLFDNAGREPSYLVNLMIANISDTDRHFRLWHLADAGEGYSLVSVLPGVVPANDVWQLSRVLKMVADDVFKIEMDFTLSVEALIDRGASTGGEA